MTLKEIIEKMEKDIDKINDNRMLSPIDIIQKINFAYTEIIPDLKKIQKEQENVIQKAEEVIK